jgi:hypothetical protein
MYFAECDRSGWNWFAGVWRLMSDVIKFTLANVKKYLGGT